MSERLEAEWWNVNAEAEEAKPKCQKKCTGDKGSRLCQQTLKKKKNCCHFLFFFRCGDRCTAHTQRAADSWSWHEIKDRNHPLSGPPRLSLLETPVERGCWMSLPSVAHQKSIPTFHSWHARKVCVIFRARPRFSSTLWNPSRQKKKGNVVEFAVKRASSPSLIRSAV